MGAGCVERRTPGSERTWGCNSPGHSPAGDGPGGTAAAAYPTSDPGQMRSGGVAIQASFGWRTSPAS